MVQTDAEQATAALQQAFADGLVYLVDEDARPLSYAQALGQRCWAQLKAADDQRTYVQELPTGSSELLQPRYLELLGLEV